MGDNIGEHIIEILTNKSKYDIERLKLIYPSITYLDLSMVTDHIYHMTDYGIKLKFNDDMLKYLYEIKTTNRWDEVERLSLSIVENMIYFEENISNVCNVLSLFNPDIEAIMTHVIICCSTKYDNMKYNKKLIVSILSYYSDKISFDHFNIYDIMDSTDIDKFILGDTTLYIILQILNDKKIKDIPTVLLERLIEIAIKNNNITMLDLLLLIAIPIKGSKYCSNEFRDSVVKLDVPYDYVSFFYEDV